MQRFLTILLAVFALNVQAAATTISVFGVVMNSSTGLPQANWTVYLVSEDSAFTEVITDASGFYQTNLEVSNPINSFILGFTNDPCTGVAVVETQAISGPIMEFNFTVCGLPPANCYAWATFEQTDSLTVQFQGGYSDSTGAPGQIEWFWDFGDGEVSNEQNPVHTYQQGGIYQVTLVVTTDTCTAFATVCFHLGNTTKVIHIKGRITDNQTGAPIPYWYVETDYSPFVMFTDEQGYYWGDIAIPLTDTTVNIYTFTTCDTFEYLSVTAPVINDTATADFVLCPFVVVNPDPCSVYIEAIQLDSFNWSFSGYYFSQDSFSQQNLIWNWSFGDGSTSNLANPVHTYTTTGLYDVHLEVTDTVTGCTAYTSYLLFGWPDCPVDSFFYNCQAMFVTTPVIDSSGTNTGMFFYSLSVGNVEQYTWDFGDGSPVDQTSGPYAFHQYDQPGVYAATLWIETYDGCESGITLLVSAGNYPGIETDCQAMFLPFPGAENEFLFVDLSVAPNGIQSWYWDFGDGQTSNLQSPVHTYTTEGVYQVTLSISGPDCTSSIAFLIDTEDSFFRFNGEGGALNQSVVSSVNTPNSTELSVHLYPNPAGSQAALLIESGKEMPAQVCLFDLNGRLQQQKTVELTPGQTAVTLDLSSISAGACLVQVRTEAGIKTIRLMHF